jgi:outer membrane biosynthesis protein TonB
VIDMLFVPQIRSRQRRAEWVTKHSPQGCRLTDPVEITPSGVGSYDFVCAGRPATGGTGGEFMTGYQHTPRPPVEEPPNRPVKPPVEEPDETPPEPPLPDEPPVEEPPQRRREPPVKEPPPDPDREPPEPPVRSRRQAASGAGCGRESDLI